MEAGFLEQPLIVVVGPTASGKTALAIEVAERYSGEIICADSRTIYKGMDIGTAKPTSLERQRVPHWGLDLVSPDERFSAADFKEYALGKIKEIRSRGHIPFLVGGSGLYVDAIVFDYSFSDTADNVLRKKLDALSIEEIHNYCNKNNILLPENSKNKRYLIRAIERTGDTLSRKALPIDNSIIVGIATDREILKKRIANRAEQIFEDNVVTEATILGRKYGWDHESMTGNIYPLVRGYLGGSLSFDEMKEKFITLDRRLAKRQLTWLRRNPYIKWGTREEIQTYLTEVLARRE